MKHLIAALIIGLALATDVQAGVLSTTDAQDGALIRSLGPGIEELVVRTKPPDWAVRHACLYYALAGQYLLARHGIDARLVVGAVLYYPYTPYQHRISPHAWLETDTQLIDYSTLPRLGYISVIPLSQVARHYGELKATGTRILTFRRPADPQLVHYLDMHRTHFQQALSLVDGE